MAAARPASSSPGRQRQASRVLAVTDHDTVSGCEAAAAACAAAGIDVRGRDRNHRDARRSRRPRARLFHRRRRARRFTRFWPNNAASASTACVRWWPGSPRSGSSWMPRRFCGRPSRTPGKSAGRPWIARALVAGGHVASTNEAFDRWLGRGKPAFVPRLGASPADVISRIHAASGLASLAHPGLLGHDEWIGGLVSDGLDALEAYHSEHDNAATARYLAMASTLGNRRVGRIGFPRRSIARTSESGRRVAPARRVRRAGSTTVRLKPDTTYDCDYGR